MGSITVDLIVKPVSVGLVWTTVPVELPEYQKLSTRFQSSKIFLHFYYSIIIYMEDFC